MAPRLTPWAGSWTTAIILLLTLVGLTLLGLYQLMLNRRMTNLSNDLAAASIFTPGSKRNAEADTFANKTALDDLRSQQEQLQDEVHAIADQLKSLEDRVTEASEFSARLDSLDTKIAQLQELSDTLRENQAQQANLQPVVPGSAAAKGRPWGPEQATGPPDTAEAGDVNTAWTSREQDGGQEWLLLEFSRPVEAAELRVRQSFNAGAISRVTLMSEIGAETTIWRGQHAPQAGIVEVAFKVPGTILTRHAVVYLDTTRVPGWNEIDAVELVARDGARQWAETAQASSTYAEQ